MCIRDSGHTVHSTTDALEALELARRMGPRLDALVTDVIMPEMRGPELAMAIQEVLPELPVLYMSGYTADAFEGLDVQREHLMRKPFRRSDLLGRVHAMLDSHRRTARGEEQPSPPSTDP